MNYHLQTLVETMRSQQQQQQQPLGYGGDETGLSAGFDSNQFFEENWNDERLLHQEHQTDITPLPLNLTHHQASLPHENLDRQVLEDLYKTLHGENHGAYVYHTGAEATSNSGFSSHLLDQQTMQQVQQMNTLYLMDSNQQTISHHLNQLTDQFAPHQAQQPVVEPVYDAANLFRFQDTIPAFADGSFNMQQLSQQSTKDSCLPPFKSSIAKQQELKPVKALSAYNYFFRDERERILNGEEGDDDYSQAKQESLLSGHWFRDRTKKRRHRKSHGKIAFTTLSRMVSLRWKDLSTDRKEFFKNIAAKDLDRYRRELNELKSGGGNGNGVSTSSVLIARSA